MFDWINNLSPGMQIAVWGAIKVLAVLFLAVLPMVSYYVVAERRISAWIQDRVGPNRVGIPLTKIKFFGLGQPLADAVKSILKEDFMPGHVRKIYFWIAPMLTLIPAFLVLAVIPFGSTLGAQKMVIADLNVGILYTFGIVSLGVYGIVLAGYAANSKYPFLGGIRSSAQLVSYELAMGMSVVPIFMLVGDLNLSAIIGYQQGTWASFLAKENQTGALAAVLHVFPNWLIFKLPFCFFIFLISAFAETNRLPFDLPESETELVAGYNTEYSSMKFAMFFMGEYTNMIAASAMMVTLFFGGWTLPWFGLDQPATSILGGFLHIGIFVGKMLVFMVLFIWVRWMLPRFRYDQLMDLGWRRFVPFALANILFYAVVLWATSSGAAN